MRLGDISFLQKLTIEAKIHQAEELMMRGDSGAAELLFRQVLSQTATSPAESRGLTSIALMGLHDICEKDGRKTESAEIWERLRTVIVDGYSVNDMSMLNYAVTSLTETDGI